MSFYRPTFCELDLSHVLHNFRELVLRAKGRRLLAVVKANAYGHGAIPVAQCLEKEGAEALGVALVEEGIELREAGIRLPLFCLGGSLGASVRELEHFYLTPVLFHEEGLVQLGEASRSLTGVLDFHLKVDTGMGRLGLFPQQVNDFLRRLAQYPKLRLRGVFTHFARADEEDSTTTLEQKKQFEALENLVRAQCPNTPVFHMANSAALIDGILGDSQWVRPGLALYGAYPHPRLQKKITLKPVLTWKTQILSVKDFPPGTAISYGGTFVTARKSRVAVIPVGYADGFSRHFSNRGEVLVAGQRVPVVGRVCMDLTMIDVTEVPEARCGSEVVLIGSQSGECLRAEDLSQKIGTISYEIFCSISHRVPRVIKT